MTAMARILCVYDEGSVVDTPLIGAKGFSMLIESGGKRVLFDTGLRDRYLSHNLEYLEIDPASIDAVVVSQSHPDNCRAINALLDRRSEPVDVYAPSGLYAGKKGVLSKSAGLSDENREKVRLHDLEGWFEVAPDVWVTPPIAYADGYREAFVVIDGKRLTIVSGRARDGPGPVLDAVRQRFGRDARSFVGAILLEKVKKPVAEAYAQELDACGCTDLHLNHCTGRDGMTNMRVHFGLTGVDEFYVGMSLDV